jgi:hypothetical protein
MPFESERKPEVPWNEVQCESDMHIVDSLRKNSLVIYFFHGVHWSINWIFSGLF